MPGVMSRCCCGSRASSRTGRCPVAVASAAVGPLRHCSAPLVVSVLPPRFVLPGMFGERRLQQVSRGCAVLCGGTSLSYRFIWTPSHRVYF
ncbi:unnamed protein product [Gongylonema pulchrum]|uniref:Secreted protein n=1 Tax=Gongylonema pulchrum TaxID=637853 RepID=A0A183EG60_9BILA|nr:unnamed protein product [Gongylonema pulchrum]